MTMSATDPAAASRELEARRRRARRTALYVAGVALAVYVGFILTGVLGR